MSLDAFIVEQMRHLCEWVGCAIQAPPQRPAGCRALLPTGAGPLLSGSSDGCVRFWDAARPDASFMVCGPPQVPASPAAAHEATSQLGRGARAPVPVTYVYSHKTMQGVGVVEESCITRSTDLQAVLPFPYPP